MKNSPLIFRLYRIIRIVEQEAGMDGLDLRAKALLRLIGEGTAGGATLHVGDVVRGSALGTAPTIYASLTELQSEGWIERLPGEEDARTRRLNLTPRARKAFDRMSRMASKSMAASED